MSITDELRKVAAKTECANGRCEKLYRGDLEHIADRIDAEHESACAEAYGNGVMSVPIALDESAWVELPKDADGEYIHAGDVLDGYGKTIEVVELRHGRSGWVLISRDGNGYADTFAFTHHHAPTVEDVLTEFGIDWEHESDCEDRAALLKEYAAKLRLAGSDVE